MNYSQQGIVAKQKALNAKSGKFGRKLALTLLILLLVVLVGVGILGMSAALGMYNGILASTPKINSSQVAPQGTATFIYDIKGNQVEELVASNSNRIEVTSEEIPQDMKDAIVAIEDRRFYEHNGIDFIGILRAGYNLVTSLGKDREGASTITQQLLKNTVFTEWTEEGNNLIKTVKRKIQEQYLAIEISKIIPKDVILTRYLNTVNFGQNSLGVETASQRYFGKSVSELTLSECATIAVITQNPSKWNPISHPENNVERRKTCLDNMLEQEFITQAEYDEAIADDVYARIEKHNVEYLESNVNNSYFTDALIVELKRDLLAAGYSESQTEDLLFRSGLRIYSTQDPDIQAAVDAQVANPKNYPENTNYLLAYQLSVTGKDGKVQHYSKEMMTKYFKENVDADFDLLFTSPEAAQEAIDTYKAAVMVEGDECEETISITPQPQVSVVVMNQENGYIAALCGGRGEKEGSLTYNRATSAYRQPGSTFKVLAAYAPALDSAGLTLASVFNDAPFMYDDGKLVNNWYSDSSQPYKGICNIRYGIEESLNIVAVKTLTQITPQLGYDYLLNFGFTSLANGLEINGQLFYDNRQPLALGGITTGVSNEELTAAYATIANGGIYTKPKLYTKVTFSDGTILLDNTEPETHQVIKDTTAYLLTSAMQDVVKTGTGTSVNFDNDMAIACKTGTTTGSVDVWLTGFTPYYTCSVWAGYDNNEKMISKGANRETYIAKDLWRSIMGDIHADLPDQQFYMPTGLVQMDVCSRSGKLPIAGLCDAHVKSEYFTDDTFPTEFCDLHYAGALCSYDVNKIAAPECPFAYQGACELALLEDESLLSGSTIPIEQPDGTVIYQEPITSNICQHDATFYTNPDYLNILIQQQVELEQRALQAQIAAQQAAAAAAAAQPQQ